MRGLRGAHRPGPARGQAGGAPLHGLRLPPLTGPDAGVPPEGPPAAEPLPERPLPDPPAGEGGPRDDPPPAPPTAPTDGSGPPLAPAPAPPTAPPDGSGAPPAGSGPPPAADTDTPAEPEGRRPLGPARGLVLAAIGAAVVALLVRRDVIGPDTVLLLGVLFGSVILHEVSHGAVALGFGDDTAQKAGRLTLNPLPHVDVLGTLILPAILVLANAPPFGWAKPVPVNPRRLRDPRNHTVVVSLAGPAVNIALALAAALALRSLHPDTALLQLYGDQASTTDQFLFYLGAVNVILAVFNLIPLPPLDGSAVVERLLPARWWPGYLRLRQYSMPILLVLVLALPGALDRLFEPALEAWIRLLR